MKLYELTYLISSNLTEEEAKTFNERVSSIIKDLEGSFEDSFLQAGLIKKRLAYSIKKENEAYFGTKIFKLEPEKVSKLEKELKEEKNILRHLLLIKKISKAPIKKRSLRQERKYSAPTEETFIQTTKKDKKVELVEIEKKLEEILKD